MSGIELNRSRASPKPRDEAQRLDRYGPPGARELYELSILSMVIDNICLNTTLECPCDLSV
jgi:hypothetical protein